MLFSKSKKDMRRWQYLVLLDSINLGKFQEVDTLSQWPWNINHWMDLEVSLSHGTKFGLKRSTREAENDTVGATVHGLQILPPNSMLMLWLPHSEWLVPILFKSFNTTNRISFGRQLKIRHSASLSATQQAQPLQH